MVRKAEAAEGALVGFAEDQIATCTHGDKQRVTHSDYPSASHSPFDCR